MMEHNPYEHSGEGHPHLDAEVMLAESQHRLHRLRLDALTGNRYDPDEFDDAVLAFRAAWATARRERMADASGTNRRTGRKRAA